MGISRLTPRTRVTRTCKASHSYRQLVAHAARQKPRNSSHRTRFEVRTKLLNTHRTATATTRTPVTAVARWVSPPIVLHTCRFTPLHATSTPPPRHSTPLTALPVRHMACGVLRVACCVLRVVCGVWCAVSVSVRCGAVLTRCDGSTDLIHSLHSLHPLHPLHPLHTTIPQGPWPSIHHDHHPP